VPGGAFSDPGRSRPGLASRLREEHGIGKGLEQMEDVTLFSHMLFATFLGWDS
jgi:hypothetical protein